MPQTVHSVRERTDLGPTGLDQFFLSQNVQFSAYILYVKKIFEDWSMDYLCQSGFNSRCIYESYTNYDIVIFKL